MEPIPLTSIPGFREAITAAIAHDADARDFAFLNLPRRICGVDVVLMTLRQYLVFINLRNPVVCCKSVPDPEKKLLPAEAIGQFFWLLSPHYLAPYAPGLTVAQLRARKANSTRRRRSVMRQIAMLPAGQVQRGIRDYMRDLLADAPEGDPSVIPVTSFAAVFIDLVCSEYAITDEQLLDTPLPRIYQYLRRIIRRKNPKYPIIDKTTQRIQREFTDKAGRKTK